MNFFKRLLLSLYMVLRHLVYGMSDTEKQMLTQMGGSSGGGTDVNKKITVNSLALALLRGELTEEVRELVYRTYIVDREARKYKYIAPTLAIKKEVILEKGEELADEMGKEESEKLISEIMGISTIKMDNKFASYENEEGYDVVLIQDNAVEKKSILEEIEDGWQDYRVLDFTLKIERDFHARYRLEEFTKKLVVRKIDDTHHMLDFYVSKYPAENDVKNRYFVKEMNKVMESGLRSDITDFDKLTFITNKAMKIEDLHQYEYGDIKFVNITDYDGHYVVHFTAKVIQDGFDLVSKHYSKSMDEKYQVKAPKPKEQEMEGYLVVPTYTCEMCGKVVKWDTEAIDNAPIGKPRYADEQQGEDIGTNEYTEYMDFQVAKLTVDKYLCRECLQKYLENEYKEENEKS